MSVEAMTVVLHHSQASGTDKVVLLGIANHAGDGGAWPTVRTLARYANTGERAVQRAIAALVALGELQVDQQAGGTRDLPDHMRPNRYVVLVGCPVECDRSMNHRVSCATPGVVSDTPPGVVSDTPRVSSVTPKPVHQPIQEEPSLFTPPPLALVQATPTEPDPFDKWWALYPRKVGKDAARKAYAKAVRTTPPDALYEALWLQVPALKQREVQYQPNPATWLNQGRWQDDVAAVQETRPQNAMGVYATPGAMAILGLTDPTQRPAIDGPPVVRGEVAP